VEEIREQKRINDQERITSFSLKGRPKSTLKKSKTRRVLSDDGDSFENLDQDQDFMDEKMTNVNKTVRTQRSRVSRAQKQAETQARTEQIT